MNIFAMAIITTNPNLRDILKHYADKNSIKYDEAINGKQALDFVKKKKSSHCCQQYKMILMERYDF